MALTYTPRFGLIQWGAGTDAYTRDEANAALATIEALGAIDVTVADAAHLPAPGKSGRYIWQTDAGILYRDTGTALVAVYKLATAAPASLSPDTAGAAGAGVDQARGNHGHSMLPWAAAADITIAAFGDARAGGVANNKTVRPDHKHGMPTHTKADHDALLIDADTLDGLNSTDFEAAFPAGTVIMLAGAIPPGYLEADGSTVARATYPNLFAAIGTQWGNGDGSGTTFSLPDLRGRAPVGAGTGAGLTARTVAQRFGEETHALNTAELAAHNHGITDPTHNHGGAQAAHNHAVTDPTHGHGGSSAAHNHGVTDPGHNHGSGGHQHADNEATQFVVTGFGANGLTATGVTVACDFQDFTTNNTDPNVGSATGVTTQNATPAVTVNAAATGVTTNNTAGTVAAGATGVTTQNAGTGTGHNTMQPSAVVRFAVRT